MHTCMHMHTHTDTHTHMHTHTHTHTRARAHARTHTHTRTHARIRTHARTHTRARAHTCTSQCFSGEAVTHIRTVQVRVRCDKPLSSPLTSSHHKNGHGLRTLALPPTPRQKSAVERFAWPKHNYPSSFPFFGVLFWQASCYLGWGGILKRERGGERERERERRKVRDAVKKA